MPNYFIVAYCLSIPIVPAKFHRQRQVYVSIQPYSPAEHDVDVAVQIRPRSHALQSLETMAGAAAAAAAVADDAACTVSRRRVVSVGVVVGNRLIAEAIVRANSSDYGQSFHRHLPRFFFRPTEQGTRKEGDVVGLVALALLDCGIFSEYCFRHRFCVILLLHYRFRSL